MRILFAKISNDKRIKGVLKIMRAVEEVTFEDPRRLALVCIIDKLNEHGKRIGPKTGILSKLYMASM